MSLTIIKAGILDTLQDFGRKGYRHWGINPGGVMDFFSATLANIILGNKIEDPIVEMHFPAPVIQCNSQMIISISGADFCPHVNKIPVSNNAPIFLQPGDMLSFQKQKMGRIAYLATTHGFASDSWLDSKSTNLKLQIGGYHGRKLINGDILALNSELIPAEFEKLKQKQLFLWNVNHSVDVDDVIFILPSKDWNDLSENSRNKFANIDFSILPQSDRMGFYLQGENLTLHQKKEMVSFGVNFGAIQLLPNGQMIVLMADHQTTGGYPCIANVIVAHRPKLAQKKAGDKIRLKLTDLSTAEYLHQIQQKKLQQLQTACFYKWKQ